MTEAFRKRSLPACERAEDLLSQMTLDEKLAQLGGAWASRLFTEGRLDRDRAFAELGKGIGHVTRISAETGLRPHRTAAVANEIQKFLVEETRLGIPAIVHEESTAGFCARGATQFPQAIGLAATFDPDLVEEVAAVIASQLAAVGARQTLAPVLDVARDPRWGRIEETYGEDPYLCSRMGVSYVRGIQGLGLSTGVAATAKHFVAHGISEGGRNHAPVYAGARELREVHAAPFRAVIHEADVASVMNAYHSIDGLPCGGSREILDDLLRKELGFDGVVVADYWTLHFLITHHSVAIDEADAGRVGIEAGIDVELPAFSCYKRLTAMVGETVPLELVDRSVLRGLKLKFELGLFENPFVDAQRAPECFDTVEQRALARSCAQKSVVLLENDGVLPLTRATRVALIGPAADDGRLMLGDYHYPAHTEIFEPGANGLPTAGGLSSDDEDLVHVEIVTLLQGLRNADINIVYSRGCSIDADDASGIADAVHAANNAEVAIVCVGGRSGLGLGDTTGEMRDSCTLALPGPQGDLVDAVLGTGTPTVLVLISGRPLVLGEFADRASAVVQAWVPGEEAGNALADVLFGLVSPSGRLPVSMPRSVGQLPSHSGHRSGGDRSQVHGEYVEGPVAPRWPFGHGLTYAIFDYSDLVVVPESPGVGEKITVSFTLTNVGSVEAVEVVQCYLRDAMASVVRPIRQLAGFCRVPLHPGESARVTFDFDGGVLAFYDTEMLHIAEPGTTVVMVGASSVDVRLEKAIEVVGSVVAVDANSVRPATCSVVFDNP